MTLILQTFPMPPGPQADLERDYEVRQAPFPDGDELRAAAVGSVGVIAGTEPWSRELLEANAGTLRCISRVGTGVDSIDLDAATDAGVAVLNGPGEMSQTVAEYAVGMMWTLARRILDADASVRTEGFAKRIVLMGNDLAGKTVGIVGFGDIGRRVATICQHGFSMRVLVTTANPDPARLRAAGIDGTFVSLPELLSQSDFVTLHTPVTAETTEIIGREELQLMKPGAFLINSSRGRLVDEAAVVEALHDGRLGGLGSDVFAVEPPPEDHPFFDTPRTILTPHFGSHSHESMFRMGDRAVRNLREFLEGGRPERTVNPEVYDRLSG